MIETVLIYLCAFLSPSRTPLNSILKIRIRQQLSRVSMRMWNLFFAFVGQPTIFTNMRTLDPGRQRNYPRISEALHAAQWRQSEVHTNVAQPLTCYELHVCHWKKLAKPFAICTVPPVRHDISTILVLSGLWNRRACTFLPTVPRVALP